MKTILSIGLIFTCISVKCQNVYSSIQLGGKYSNEQITKALNNANWCGYYHESKNFEITFDDGAKAYLKSKKELLHHTSKLESNCFQAENSESQLTHMISKNGMIIVRAEKNIKTKSTLNR